MATIDELESALRKAHAAGNTAHAKRFADEIRNLQSQPTKETSLYQQAGQLVEEYAPALPELGAAITRGATQAADFFGNIARVPANRMLEMAGSDYRIPTLTESAAPVTQGNFMEPGLARDVVRATGETAALGGVTGAGLRTAGRMLPSVARPTPARPKHYSQQAAVTMPGESTALGTARSLTQTTPVLEAGLGGLAGAGAEFGERIGGETGEAIGAIAAPMIPTIITKGLVNKFSRLFENMSGKDINMQAQMLGEAMQREGIGPDEAAEIYRQMGPEAVPADIGTSFARLLRYAVNKAPRIEGQQRQILNQRHEQTIQRLDDVLNKTGRLRGQNLDEALAQIDQVMTPEINRLYGEARTQPLQMSRQMRTILETKGRVNDAFRQAQKNLSDMRLAGEQITHVSVIDETKKVLDDKIGKAIKDNRKNEARNLVILKNKLIDEADASIPKYKEARNAYAGKAALEDAGDMGRLYLKLKPERVRELTSRYSDSEKKMFKLGMRDALLERVDDLKIGADTIRATFGKKGDLKKLRFLFDDTKDFEQFRDALKLESEFALTRRTAQGNSTTWKQAEDSETFSRSIEDAIEMLSMPDGTLGFLAKAARMLRNTEKGSQAFMDALEETGDFLLLKGVPPEKVRDLLREGNKDRIIEIAQRLEKKPLRYPPVWAASALTMTRDEE